MFKFGGRKHTRPHIDLETVRETLLYMESDCRDYPDLEGVAAALALTLAEIDRVEDCVAERPRVDVISASFVPAGL